MRWSVPPMWPGRTVVILASGPSMSPAVAEAVRVEHIQNRLQAIAISDTFKLAPWADCLYSADAKWWAYHAQQALNFPGLKIGSSNVLFPSVLTLEVERGTQPLSRDPSRIVSGLNSAYQAMNIATLAGASRVLLTGCDMQGGHWFGEHPKPLATASPFGEFIRKFEKAAPALVSLGVSVINCTPGSRLTCFPMMDLTEALTGPAVKSSASPAVPA